MSQASPAPATESAAEPAKYDTPIGPQLPLSKKAKGPPYKKEPGPLDDTFASLKHRIKYTIWSALVNKPFGFKTMSAVQKEVLGLLPELADPAARGGPAMDSRSVEDHQKATDLLVKAKTGTGKTIAFLVPALQARLRDVEYESVKFSEANPTADKHTKSRHMNAFQRETVGAITLSPTRELATQIATEAKRLMHHFEDMDVQLFIGGASKELQYKKFRRHRKDILVATPGRLIDMLAEPEIRDAVTKAKMLIFDEADTLLDMGFKDQIQEIIDYLPPKGQRQTFMFSATVSPEVRQISRAALRPDHKFIDCVPAHEANAHLHIPQFQTVLPPEEQLPHIYRLLAHDALTNPGGSKAIVFLPTTKGTQLYATLVNQMRSSLPWGLRNTRVLEMHAQKSQSARDRVAADFRAATGPGQTILVTTDVSARGVDYPGVTRVIQVGLPPSRDNYVHRLGRTGRAGKSGRGDFVLMPWEADYVRFNLQDMPLKTVESSALSEELEQIASAIDADPRQFKTNVVEAVKSETDRTKGGYSPSKYGAAAATLQTPLLPRIQNLPTKFKEEILPELSPTEVEDAFASQLGFYVGRVGELRAQKYDVYEGVRQWTSATMGLERPARVSMSMMNKLGIKEPRSNSFSAGFGSRGSRSDFSSAGSRFSNTSSGRSSFDFDRRRSDREGVFPRDNFRSSFSGRGDRERGSFGRSDRDRGSFSRSSSFEKPSFRLSSDRESRGSRSDRFPF